MRGGNHPSMKWLGWLLTPRLLFRSRPTPVHPDSYVLGFRLLKSNLSLYARLPRANTKKYPLQAPTVAKNGWSRVQKPHVARRALR